MSALAPWLLSVLRIVTALLDIPHGTSKIFGFPRAGSGATVELYSLLGLAGSLEMVGGALILVGLFTRPVAFVLSGEMAFAYFMAHAPRNLHPLLNQGELPILFCFIYLYLAFAGAGPLISACARNLSASGVFVQTGADVSVGAVVDLKLGLPDRDRPVGVQAKVVHRVVGSGPSALWSEPGVGLQFIGGDDSFRGRLDRYLTAIAR